MADKGGLVGIVVARSRLCLIDGVNGVLIYGGYDVGDLAEHSSYEEVCFLTLRGRLPTAPELAAFIADLSTARPLSSETASVIDMLASHAAPMEMLRTAVSADSFDDPDKSSNEESANFRKATRLIAKMPTMVARYDRRRRGLEPIEPDAGLGHAANFLWMLSGERPDQQAAKTFDVALILHADHEMNASTFTARVIASTLSDMHSAITGAIGALKGPLHGGANEQVMHLLADIGSDENIEQEIRGRLDRK
ncbi:MAG: citrate synthase, partial [Gaiellales bacterium]|nr:citrate synthase [Gaiellales bacterium]